MNFRVPGMPMRMIDKEDELALFLEMRKIDKERDSVFLHNSDEFDASLGTMGNSPIYDIAASLEPSLKTASDEFLNSEGDKNDYEWLLSPPGTPLFPSLEMESQNSVTIQTGTPEAHPTALKSRLADVQLESTASNLASRQSALSPGLNMSSGGVRRPSSSGGPGPRSATPTRRPTQNSASKPVLTSAPKPSSAATSKPSVGNTSKPLRSSTPTSRATLTSTKPTVPARSSTPTRSTARSSAPTPRSTARSSTPTSRTSSLPASKPTSRATTPTRRPTTLSTASDSSSPPVKSPSLFPKVATATSRYPVPPRVSSPIVKPRPWKPSEMPGFSLDVPPNLRTSLSEKPISATRGKPGSQSIRSSSVEPAPNGRIRRQSCSPSRGRPPNGVNVNSRSSVPALSRAYANANDNVSPVMYGTKMVERVMNMRKLAPPRQDDKHSPHSNLSGKSSSPDSSGFGRSLSKKSLDMAMRHMDIRRSIPGNLRPLMKNIPASSMYSVRSGPAPGSRIVGVQDSPIATSSNASSEVSVNNNAICLDRSEIEDDINSERGVPPASVLGSSLLAVRVEELLITAVS
ncbi:endochitinase A [Heracleum sosnowskyi]|uniref:Endochitinase A n=1 Tax=Heracleum sosnowskyi TaxID=360622 RepID=A0AAD8GVS9_9APIA|nr:endochitinase A [Heracleum sosnowskyi]